MIWLALCIVFTSFLIIAFKYFEKYKVVTMPGIAFNYLTCALLGFAFQKNHASILHLSFEPWVIYSVILGLLFIVVFYLLGRNTQINGITVGAIANKLSVVIPIAVAIVAYNEKVTALKITGIVLALLSVVLTNIKSKTEEGTKVEKRNWLLPFVVFIGSGMCDSLLNFIQKFFLPAEFNELFIFFVFGTAFLAGFVASLYNWWFKNISFGKKEIIAGILLGIPNFGSIFSILKALQTSGLEHSVMWPINNVGVIVFSAIYSVIFFKEKLSAINLTGIGVAIAAIILMTL
jgi:drug/metabolite transporter (DMT)-like permease